jgi:uncharacterized membrane protein YhfC
LGQSKLESSTCIWNRVWGYRGTPFYAFAPVWECFFTILTHILANVLILYAITVRKPSYFWLAFIYKTLIDTVAAYAQVTGVEILAKNWAIELIIAIFGVMGWLGLRWISKKYPPLEQPVPS